MYTISFRHEYNLLDIQWQRLFDLAGVERYAAELVDRFRKEGFTNGYRLRIDMGACSVQPCGGRSGAGVTPKPRDLVMRLIRPIVKAS